MTREQVDKAIYDYVAANGLDPTEYDYSEFNQLLDDVDGNAPCDDEGCIYNHDHSDNKCEFLAT